MFDLRGFSILLLVVFFGVLFFPRNAVSAQESEVIFTLQIIPVRIAVVDEQNEILELWNHVKTSETYYELQIRLGTPTGQLLLTTTSILEDYENLIPFVDLEKQGVVYNAAQGVTQKYNDVKFLRTEQGPAQEIYTYVN